MSRRYWTLEEIEYLQEAYAATPMQEICQRLNCSPQRVYAKAAKMDLYRDADFLANMNSSIGKKLAKCEAAVSNRFKKGHQAHNKGAKGIYSKGAEKGWFKKGFTPSNARHDGAISVRRDSSGVEYKWIRIQPGKWKHLHRHVWEQDHGPVPKKHVITFINGDTMDVRIENLRCISMKENADRNRNKDKAAKTLRDINAGKRKAPEISLYKAALKITGGDKTAAREIIKENPILVETARINHTLKQQIRYENANSNKR